MYIYIYMYFNIYINHIVYIPYMDYCRALGEFASYDQGWQEFGSTASQT